MSRYAHIYMQKTCKLEESQSWENTAGSTILPYSHQECSSLALFPRQPRI